MALTHCVWQPSHWQTDSGRCPLQVSYTWFDPSSYRSTWDSALLLRYSTLWVSQRARSQTLCLSLPPQRLASTLLRALLSGLSTLRCGGRSDSGAGCHTRGVSLAWSPLSQALFALRFRHALTLLVTFLAAAGRGSPFTGFRFELLLRSGSTLVVGCQSDRGVAAVALHSTFLPARCGITPVPLKASCLRVGSYGA